MSFRGQIKKLFHEVVTNFFITIHTYVNLRLQHCNIHFFKRKQKLRKLVTMTESVLLTLVTNNESINHYTISGSTIMLCARKPCSLLYQSLKKIVTRPLFIHQYASVRYANIFCLMLISINKRIIVSTYIFLKSLYEY